MHDIVNGMAQYAAYFLEAIATLVIFVGSIRALVLYLSGCMFSKHCFSEFNIMRIRLGHSLSLGLEFLIGADILKSAVSPTWEGLGQLATIVAIRSTINFLLIWELKEIESREKTQNEK